MSSDQAEIGLDPVIKQQPAQMVFLIDTSHVAGYKHDKQITKDEKEIIAETQDFNVSPTKRGRNHGCQGAKLHHIGKCLQTP
jgi:hypothetical protein